MRMMGTVKMGCWHSARDDPNSWGRSCRGGRAAGPNTGCGLGFLAAKTHRGCRKQQPHHWAAWSGLQDQAASPPKGLSRFSAKQTRAFLEGTCLGLS